VLLAADPWYANVAGVLLTATPWSTAALLRARARPSERLRLGRSESPLGRADELDQRRLLRALPGVARKHMRHHTDRADVLTFGYKKFLSTAPSW